MWTQFGDMTDEIKSNPTPVSKADARSELLSPYSSKNE